MSEKKENKDENSKETHIVVRDSRTREERINAYKKVCNKIENEIDVVEEVILDDYAPKYADSAQIIITLKAKEKNYYDNNHREKSGYKITYNLVSVRKKINSILDEVNGDIVNVDKEAVIKPEKITNTDNTYKEKIYMFDLYSW